MITMIETMIQTEKVLIREYQKEDFEEVILILAEISESHSVYFNKEAWTAWTGLRVTQPGYRRTTLVAETDQKVVGIGLIEFVIENLDGEAVGYLSNWGVKAEYRNLGIGRLLVEKAIRILTDIHADVIKINVATIPNPSRVLDLVKSVGFEPRYISVEKRLKGAKQLHTTDRETMVKR
jgi:ribosomal protein S18 acetylase RimI-like enzyme